jgi:hypothetical protein
MLEVLLFAFLAIIVGLGLSFMGYAAFRILLPILGFLAGFWLGLDLVQNFALNYPLLGVSLGLILGLVLGAVFAAIAYFVYALAVVIFGISLGYALGAGLMLLIGFPPGLMTFLVGVVVAAAMGVLFYRTDMPKLYIMALTAFAGASAMIAGILVLFGQIPPSQLGLAVVEPYIKQSWFLLLVWVILGGVGFAVQYQMVKMSQTMVPEAYSYDVTTKEYAKKAKKTE